jgi:hypothetical protein
MTESWADLLRQAIENDERSRYAIAKAAVVQESQLARFMAGTSLDLATAERIGRVLGVELLAPKKRRKRG